MQADTLRHLQETQSTTRHIMHAFAEGSKQGNDRSGAATTNWTSLDDHFNRWVVEQRATRRPRTKSPTQTMMVLCIHIEGEQFHCHATKKYSVR